MEKCSLCITSTLKRYGKTFEEIWRGNPLINTIEPANIQKIATLAFEDYSKDHQKVIAQAPLLGPSVFSDGPIWKYARSKIKPIFARAELSDMDHFALFRVETCLVLCRMGKLLNRAIIGRGRE
jgi:cytochrome P450 monooxygenase